MNLNVSVFFIKRVFILFDTETELLHETNKIGYEIVKLWNGKKG